MLPNLNVPPIQIFGLDLHLFGFLVGLAIIVGTILAGRRAKQLGLSERVVADVAIWAVVVGFIGAHLYSAIFYFPEKIADNPLYLLKMWDGISSFGGFIGGTLGVLIYFKRHKDLPFLPYADAIIYGFAFAWIFGRLGCTTAYDHPGSLTDFVLGMDYQGLWNKVTQSWDITPGVRHNLGMYEFFWAVLMSAFFFFNRKKPHFKGWFLGMFVVFYMPVRFGFDFLRKADIHHFGLTAGQWAAIVLFVLGIVLMVKGAQKGDMLVPDGQPKHRPAAEMKAIGPRAEAVAAAPGAGAVGGGKKKRKR
ncbi:MAG: prolipoprotein diacylglyceryl transferase [Deltaproteobacteria bacterium]|nr:MAG: prolipoprotein diacylglyceryl transferase [Deltaproteobacteria bacterium]